MLRFLDGRGLAAPDAAATQAVRALRGGRRGDAWELGLPYEDVRFTTDDGVTLSGWLVPARARDPRRSDPHAWLQLESARRAVGLRSVAARALPRPAVRFPRATARSGDADITLGTAERHDAAAAVRLLEGRGLGPIALMGMSMGAAVAILAAPDLPVAAVVADAPYAELHHPIANRMREWHYPLAGWARA